MAPVNVSSMDDLIKLHKDWIDHAQYSEVGMIESLHFAGDVGQPSPPWSNVMGRVIDFQNAGPLLGIGPSKTELLITTPVPVLPKLRDINAAPQLAPSVEELKRRGENLKKPRVFSPGAVPEVQQKWEYVSDQKLKGSYFLCVQPVVLISFRFGSTVGLIDCEADGMGKHMGLLIDTREPWANDVPGRPRSGRAYLVYGKWRFRQTRTPADLKGVFERTKEAALHAPVGA
jgi:hypothetical protein